MADIVPISGGQNLTPSAAIKDHFALAIKPAQETLDAVLKLIPARTWLDEWKNHDPSYRRILLTDRTGVEFGDAEERLALVPDLAFLQRAAQLVADAEHKPAPEAWVHLVIGSMLAQMPNSKNVAPDYQFGIVDMVMNNEDIWARRYAPGFSAPVLVLAVREARRKSDFVPAGATILEACQRHRKRFCELAGVVTLLTQVRENAELYIRQAVEAGVDPLTPEELRCIEAKPRRDYPDDCPF